MCSTLRHGLSGTQRYVSRSSRGFNEALARRSDETPKMQLQTDSGSVGTSATHTDSSWIFLWGGNLRNFRDDGMSVQHNCW